MVSSLLLGMGSSGPLRRVSSPFQTSWLWQVPEALMSKAGLWAPPTKAQAGWRGAAIPAKGQSPWPQAAHTRSAPPTRARLSPLAHCPVGWRATHPPHLPTWLRALGGPRSVVCHDDSCSEATGLSSQSICTPFTSLEPHNNPVGRAGWGSRPIVQMRTGGSERERASKTPQDMVVGGG